MLAINSCIALWILKCIHEWETELSLQKEGLLFLRWLKPLQSRSETVRHWFMQWIKNEPMARKPARRGGAIWLCKWAIAIGSQINSPSVTTIFPSLIYGTALPLTPPLCRPWIPATPNQGWMPNFSVSSLKRSKSWDWSDLHRRSPLVAVWMNGSCQGKIRPLVSEPPRFFRKDGSPHSELPWRLAHLSPVEGRANIPQVLLSSAT